MSYTIKVTKGECEVARTLTRLRTTRNYLDTIMREAGDIGLVLLARGLLGLACSAISGFLVWLAIWSYVHGPALTGTTFVATLALVVGIPSGLVTAILWHNLESPRRVRWMFALVALSVAVAAPYVVMLVKGIETYYGLFFGVLRLPVIDVADALYTALIASSIAANVVAAVLATYRMSRYREI